MASKLLLLSLYKKCESDNPKILWEIAQELNNEKLLSNSSLSKMSNILYYLQLRKNARKLKQVKNELRKTITKNIASGEVV